VHFFRFGQYIWQQICQQIEHEQQGQITLLANRKSCVTDFVAIPTLAKLKKIKQHKLKIDKRLIDGIAQSRGGIC